MKLRREHWIAIAAIAAVLITIGCVYQFYYQKRLAEYAANIVKLKDLEKALNDLETTFENRDPEVVIKAYNGQVEPLAEKVVQRAQFFNTTDALQIEPIPEGKLLRFWYTEQFNKLFEELRKDAASRTPQIPYPDNSTFGAPRPEELEGRAVNPPDVKRWLRQIKFASYIIKMLMDAKAIAINDVQLWTPQLDFDKLLTMRTVGLWFAMPYSDLVKFLDKLRMDTRYFNVNAISIQNPYMRWATEPPVEVRMLLTQADFNAAVASPAPAAAPGGAPLVGGAPTGSPTDRLTQAGFPKPSSRQQPEVQISRWHKIKNFLRNWYLWPF